MTDYFTQNIETIITRLGYECVHVGIRTDFGRMKVQILIDTLGGINVEDCELVSGRVNKFLDEHPDIPELDKGRYYLEVSSPGIERPLYKITDYERFSGKQARLRLSELLEGRKTFTGIIQRAEDDEVILKCEDKDIHIPFEIIKGGNLVYRFGNENENETHKEHKRTKKKGKK